MWFTGRPAAEGAGLRDANGTTGAQYVANVTHNMGGSAAATLNAVPEQDILGQALNPVAAGAVANAAAGIAPKAPPTLTPAPTALDQVPEQDILGQALASAPAAAQSAAAPPVASTVGNPIMASFKESLAAGASAVSPGNSVPPSWAGTGASLDALNSLPIAGPAVLKGEAGANALLSYIPSSRADTGSFADRYAAEQAGQAAEMQGYNAANPREAIAARLAGGALGSAGMVAAAPAAFGINAGAGLLTNALAGAASNAGVSGIDAAVRGGSLGDIGRSAAIGGVAGAAAPLLGGAMNALGRGLTGGAMRQMTPRWRLWLATNTESRLPAINWPARLAGASSGQRPIGCPSAGLGATSLTRRRNSMLP